MSPTARCSTHSPRLRECRATSICSTTRRRRSSRASRGTAATDRGRVPGTRWRRPGTGGRSSRPSSRGGPSVWSSSRRRTAPVDSSRSPSTRTSGLPSIPSTSPRRRSWPSSAGSRRGTGWTSSHATIASSRWGISRGPLAVRTRASARRASWRTRGDPRDTRRSSWLPSNSKAPRRPPPTSRGAGTRCSTRHGISCARFPRSMRGAACSHPTSRSSAGTEPHSSARYGAGRSARPRCSPRAPSSDTSLHVPAGSAVEAGTADGIGVPPPPPPVANTARAGHPAGRRRDPGV